MNSCWQVARTYLGRLRFWIFGGLYAWLALWVLPIYWAPRDQERDRIQVDMGLIFSILLACLVGCLAALHLRRLLSGPAAHVVPRFAVPHLLVGAIVSLALWVALPWAQADRTGLGPWRVIALHSLAGTLSALVLVWPRAIVLLGLVPVLLVWAADGRRPGVAFLVRFFNGEEPAASTAAILLAALAYPVTALVLLRTRDRAATFSDDLAVDRSHEVTSRWKQPLLALRDGAIEWQLSHAGGFTWRLRRWLVPCTASWMEFGLIVALVIGVMTATGLAAGSASGTPLISAVAGIVVLFIPLSSWRFRCTALAGEFVRPLTRRQFARQFMAAMLWDFAAWTALAGVTSALGYVPMIWAGERGVLSVLGIHVVCVGSAAVLLYGIALITLRLRYWMPWFLGLLVGSLFVLGHLIRLVAWWWVDVLRLARPGSDLTGSFVLIAVFGGFGLLLLAFTYRRWLNMEIA